jgi:polyphosphate kinase
MFFNRDLSWLSFNYRVLQEAACKDLPLFERFHFLSIFSSNLDEFFRVRFPVVLAISKLKKKTREKIEHKDLKNLADKIQTEIEAQLQEFGDILSGQLIPELRSHGIVLYYKEEIKDEHKAEIKDIFLSKILSFIQPIFLDNKSIEKFLPENNQLFFLVTLNQKADPALKHCVVNIPSEKLNRLFTLSPIDGVNYTIFIDDIIRENMHLLFPGFKIQNIYSFKFNRDAELNLADEYRGNILKKIEKQIKKRELGPPSRFLYESDMPRNLQLFIASEFDVEHEEMYAGGRYHNLKDLSKLPKFGLNLNYPPRTPFIHPLIKNATDIFRILDEHDVLLHIPYDSYNPVLSFFNQSAIDPDVSDIFITLYRVAADSHIVNALISAAKNGKNVTAFVELKARFDEANNISWSKKMKEAGVNIIYSIPEIKVHSKIALVIKNHPEGRRMYSILSTGNFNEFTARFYTDHTLLTTRKSLTNDLLGLFYYLSSIKGPVFSDKLKFSEILVSGFNMVSGFRKLIEKEIKKAENGEAGLIRIKLNNLEDPEMIELLYLASKAGVKVELIVRSICCLVPGVIDLSENIIVKRIVDRYLEHSRIFIFGIGEEATVLMGSSDWMIRNLRHRVEVVGPIENKHCRRELIDYFDLQWRDNDKSVYLATDMAYTTCNNDNGTIYNAQNSIYEYLKGLR